MQNEVDLTIALNPSAAIISSSALGSILRFRRWAHPNGRQNLLTFRYGGIRVSGYRISHQVSTTVV